MKTIYSLIFSVVAIILSIVAICMSMPRKDVTFDYLGLIIGIQGVLVTVLIGWNIYMIVDFRQEKEKLQQYFEEQKKSVSSVGSDVMATFMSQLSHSSLLEKSIADVYAQLMGLHKLTPLFFEYLYHTLGSIVTAAQAENYDICNNWIQEINLMLSSSEKVVMPVSNKQLLIKTVLQIPHSKNIVGLEDMINLLSRVSEIPDPVS